MLAIACIKQVPDTAQVQIGPVINTLAREGIPFIVNPIGLLRRRSTTVTSIFSETKCL